MPEARYMVPSRGALEGVKIMLARAGAQKIRHYSLTDILYGPELSNDRYVRLRIARETGAEGYSITLVHKVVIWGLYSKKDIVIFSQGFPDITTADIFVDTSYSHVYRMEHCFSRSGTCFALDDAFIFVEEIRVSGIEWSVEIEGLNDHMIAECARLLCLGEPIRATLPVLVRSILR